MTTITPQVNVEGIAYELADLRTIVDIDRDLPNHDGRWANESWFVVANLDAAGDPLGFQVHVLLMELPVSTSTVIAARQVSDHGIDRSPGSRQSQGPGASRDARRCS